MLILLGFVFLLQFAGELVYVRNTFLGKSQPNRITFFLWAFIPAIALAAGISVGETWALLPVFMVGFGPFLILIASFFNSKAYWKLGYFDYFSGLLAVLAIVLWVLTKDPATAVLFSILADGFAALPTLKKSWQHPETETGLAYGLASLNATVGITVLHSFDFTNLGFLAYTVFINLCLAVSVYRKGFFSKVHVELFDRNIE